MTTLQESRKLVPQIASCDASLDYGSPVVDGLVAISTPTRLVRSESDASCDYGDWGLESSSAREMTEHDVVISRAFVSQERFEREASPFVLNVRREGIPV